MTDEPAAWVALEAFLIVGVLAILPRRPWSRALAWACALAVVLATLIAVVDVVFLVSLGRSLNLFLDLYLLSAVYNLAVGNAGLVVTLLGFVGALLALVLATVALARLLAPAPDVDRRDPPRFSRRVGALGLVALGALGLVVEATPARERTATPLVQLVRAQGGQLRATRRERELFGSELASAPDSYGEVPGLLADLRGRDVLLTFIESYGVAALDDPEFRAVVGPTLDSLEARMEAAGVHLATGTLTSPTRGGQSWYAHGTVISGLWLENQLRYDLMLASDRETMVDDFRRAGHRTITIMPAITMAWPDGVRLGYDEVHTSENIPYEGPPLYWVTMPDQFTWSFLEKTVRSAPPGQPLFVETAMVSSHAPWTPVLPIVDWDSIGDGAGFEAFRQEGHPPEELWIDIDVLRSGYAQSLDYSLRAMAGFAERSLDERTLLIVMGDHQAAPWVTGATSADVPVHVFAKDPALLEPFLAWGFEPGAFPDTTRTPPRMDGFRDWLVRAFSDGAGDAATDHSHPTEGP